MTNYPVIVLKVGMIGMKVGMIGRMLIGLMLG